MNLYGPKSSRLRSLLIGAALLAGLTACGGPPNWVTVGSGAMDGEQGKAFYGVGSVVGVSNEPLAWVAAENRARAEIARNVETFIAYMMRDYAASTTAGDFSTSTEEQHIEQAIKTFASVTLSGVRPIDRYRDSTTKTYYVLAKLSINDMQKTLAKAKELNGEVRDFVRNNAERLFDSLAEEEAKRGS